MPYTVSSEAERQAYERAEEQIRSDMSEGAISDYIDGDASQEYLGELIRLQQQTMQTGESLQHWMARVDADVEAKIQQIIDAAVENNVHRVAGELK